MKKNNYTAPSIEVVDIQGDVVMAATSGDNRFSTTGGSPQATINGSTMDQEDADEGMSASYGNVWDDGE